jgi:glycosyltransferase involved in cell wall biosynthesis
VLDLHNIESVLQRRLAAESALHGPFFHRFANAELKAERRWLPRFDALLVASADDQRAAAEAAPEVPIGVIPNVLPLMPAPRVVKRDEIVFSANLAYEPNTRAVRWLTQEVWPLLARLRPELRLRLVGRGEEAVRRLLTHPRIEATGVVDDALPHIARARVAVVPLRSGSGTRIKILEAWAALTPVVSTTIGAEGLPAEGVLIADAPAAFAAAVVQLLQDETAALALARRGREIYEARFTSTQAGAALWEFLEGIAG